MYPTVHVRPRPETVVQKVSEIVGVSTESFAKAAEDARQPIELGHVRTLRAIEASAGDGRLERAPAVGVAHEGDADEGAVAVVVEGDADARR